MFQVNNLKGRHFCEFSATKLRELQSVYQNFTSPCTGNTDPDSNGHFFITPKLQKLLIVLKEDRNSKYGKNEPQLAIFFRHFNIYFCIFSMF